MDVKLTGFNGPLELLCHLIDKNEIDIYDIPISELADQYIEFLETHSMDSMSEFVLMAATLLEIKSKMLLPLPKKEDTEDVDPRQELVNRLVEYRRFKLAADGFSQREDFRCVCRMPDSVLLTYDPVDFADTLLEGVSLEDLFDVFQSVLARRELKTDKIRSGFNSVAREVFTVDDKMYQIRGLLRKTTRIRFRDVFGLEVSKAEKIVTFLAVLELIKRKEISVSQEGLFDEIHIIPVSETHEGGSTC